MRTISFQGDLTSELCVPVHVVLVFWVQLMRLMLSDAVDIACCCSSQTNDFFPFVHFPAVWHRLACQCKVGACRVLAGVCCVAFVVLCPARVVSCAWRCCLTRVASRAPNLSVCSLARLTAADV